MKYLKHNKYYLKRVDIESIYKYYTLIHILFSTKKWNHKIRATLRVEKLFNFLSKQAKRSKFYIRKLKEKNPADCWQ